MAFEHIGCEKNTFLHNKFNNISTCVWQFDYAFLVYKIPVQQIRMYV
jgi:hypothetical protein